MTVDKSNYYSGLTESEILRDQAINSMIRHGFTIEQVREIIKAVTPQPGKGHCKDCKYFEYDSMAMVDGIPLIVAHEICSKWGNGCKTSENGYCFLFEPKADMREVIEDDKI